MNVLVYTGSNVLPSSATWLRSVLRTILAPNYDVQTISAQSISTHPWASTCALLVLPTSSQLDSTSAITRYVESGGRLLALGANLECRGSILSLGSPGSIRLSDYILSFDSHSPIQSGSDPSIAVKLRDGSGECLFDDLHVHKTGNIQGARISDVLARVHSGDDITNTVVAACFDSEKGKAAIWAISVDSIPADANSTPSSDETGPNKQKRGVLRATLVKLGLRLPIDDNTTPHTTNFPSPQMLMCAPWKADVVSAVFSALRIRHNGESAPVELKDMNDTFHFWPSADRDRLMELGRRGELYQSADPASWQPKHIIIESRGSVPPSDATPLFDCAQFFKHLKQFRRNDDVLESIDGWGHGEAFIYGEVVTSTQTMIDRQAGALSRVIH
jgi:biotin---protein ligase